jgi:serine/threonine-protein kinase
MRALAFRARSWRSERELVPARAMLEPAPVATINLLGEPCRLRNRLGAGGMGTVYSADHRVEGRLAVKLLRQELSRDPLLVARMLDEAAAGQKVDHPNVVRVIGCGVCDDGLPYVAMRRISGEPMGDQLQEDGAFELARVRTIALQILSGLDAIHQAGLVHADLKSDNILLDAGDRAVIIDFGLARAPRTRLRDDEQVISGTPDYMAPELIRGTPITAAADIYAIGVILYEMVTGSTPFAAATASEIFHGHLDDDVVAPSLRRPDLPIPPALDAAICAALEKDPAARPASALVLRDLIARAIPRTWSEPIHLRIPAATTAGPTERWPRGSVQSDTVPATRPMLDDDSCDSSPPGTRDALASSGGAHGEQTDHLSAIGSR